MSVNKKYSSLGEKLYNKYSNGEKKDAYISVKISMGNTIFEPAGSSKVKFSASFNMFLSSGRVFP